MQESLEKRFDEAMWSIYRRAFSEAGYKATRFRQMLEEYGGLGTARFLIRAPKVSDGYTALWERGRLDLTVEALILGSSEWHSLFTEKEMERVRQRLEEYNYHNQKK